MTSLLLIPIGIIVWVLCYGPVVPDGHEVGGPDRSVQVSSLLSSRRATTETEVAELRNDGEDEATELGSDRRES